MVYAANTKVSPDQSRMEIERTLGRYGADAFMYMRDGHMQVIGFRADGRYVKFTVQMPTIDEFHHTGKRSRTPTQASEARNKAERERWRALLLVIKAKLEAVESGIESFEVAFLPYLVLPDQTTVAEWVGPQLERAYEVGAMPEGITALLPRGDD